MRFGKIGCRPLFTDLPYDAEVEWLYGFNGPYIRTGVNSNTELAMEVVAKFDQSKISSESSYGSFIGCNEKGSGGAIFVGFTTDKNNLRAYFGSSFGKSVLVPINAQFNTFFCSKNVSRINDTESTGSETPTIQVSREVYLFMNNTNWGGNSRPSCYIKSARFWLNNLLVRDFIPVRVGCTGYMYDKMTRTLFGNAGTGAFVVGPDKVAGGATDNKRHRTKLIRTSFSKARSRQQLRATSFSAKRNRKEAAV